MVWFEGNIRNFLRRMGMIIAVGVLVYGSLAVPLATRAKAEFSEIVFCNNSPWGIAIALVHLDDSGQHWMMTAWYNLVPRECSPVRWVRGSRVLYYAEARTAPYAWPDINYSRVSYCVGAGPLEERMFPRQCRPGERHLPFADVDVFAPGTIINLDV